MRRFAACLIVVAVLAGCEAPSPTSKAGHSTATRDNQQQTEKADFPLHWHVGNIDPRFNASAEQVRQATENAARIWEDSASTRLFVYDPNSGFTIDLVYDQREETMLEKLHEKDQLNAEKGMLALARQKQEETGSQFISAKERLEEDEHAFEQRLQSYNQRVASWNASGGAPSDVLSDLEAEKQSIEAERSRIREAEQNLAMLQIQASATLKSYNQQVISYNTFVRDYNQKFGSAVMQTVGQTLRRGDQVESITVYAFKDLNDLTLILAHELGHAIGLGHVTGHGAIMSAVENGETGSSHLQLTDRDKSALRALLAK